MKKFFNVVKIVLITLAILCGVAFVVFYIVNKEQAKQILDLVVAFVNKPLPIIGVSIVVVGCFVLKIISATAYGKRAIAKMQLEYESEKAKDKKDFEDTKIKYEAMIKTQQKQIDTIFNGFVELCDAIPNKKVKDIGDTFKNDVYVEIKENENNFNAITNESVDLLIKTKEEMVATIVELVKKEVVDKYGEREETTNC